MTLFLITAPSGAGKTSIATYLRLYGHWNELVSVTTRPMREGEKEGETYYFLDDKLFDKLLEDGKLAENVEYGGYKYGIAVEEIEKKLGKSRTSHSFAIVDYNGYEQIKALYPDAVGIFLYMKKEECMANMLLRGDTLESATKRIEKYDSEMENRHAFDYVIRNVMNKKIETQDILMSIVKQYSKHPIYGV
jgi:guanylate kinase